MGNTERVRKFIVAQRFAAPPDAIAAAYLDRATWDAFSGLPFVGDPKVASFDAGRPTTIATNYRVRIDLPALAATFIDADKLTFVEITVLHADGSGTFEIRPDHYDDLLASSGRIELLPAEDGCERRIDGHVEVDLGWSGKLFERPVEDAIVTGLSQALEAQALQVPVG